VKILDFLADIHRETQRFFLSGNLEAHRQRHTEQAHLLAELLRLAHGDFRQLGVGVPRVIDFSSGTPP
jgi:hypothetical protein